ncbi:tRNA epoxyqueuosine(34) reductase QueG [Pseudaeromonas sp. ZJS20]|uniref:tRNA epoxyqueuosine(34) reductase QueG n=1 Tax=Pseudaeromonas aegiceratis TaxID=3153928 RepID=UPI00390C67B3
MTSLDYTTLAHHIKLWGHELGFQQVGICDTDLRPEEPRLQAWLAKGYHGQMEYMARHGLLRARPAELLPGTLRVISVRMDYLPQQAGIARQLSDPTLAYISRYALGRDYHKVLRQRLKRLAQRIEQVVGALGARPFVDSAPLLERPLAAKAGLGWEGKHTLVIHKEAGSFFFLGELLVDLPLPVDEPVANQCGSCSACLTSCPTGAIIAPYELDARRCISYLTIEHEGPIPEALRPLMGNRIYGCDDCQLICPWNRQAEASAEADFIPRPALHHASLLGLWQWDEAQFLAQTEGSPIRRIGYHKWQRNIAVALGNGPYSDAVWAALQAKLETAAPLVQEHIRWALAQLQRQAQRQHNKTDRVIRCVQKGMPDHA